MVVGGGLHATIYTQGAGTRLAVFGQQLTGVTGAVNDLDKIRICASQFDFLLGAAQNISPIFKPDHTSETPYFYYLTGYPVFGVTSESVS
jgi:hypothetical protein